MNLGFDDPAFRQRMLDDYALYQHRLASRSMDERFQMLCQCQNPLELGCNAVRSGGYFRQIVHSNPLAEFLRGQIDDPFCGRGGDKVMEGGLFKGRQYCWQHYPAYAICEPCFDYGPHPSVGYGVMGSAPEWVYVWEYRPQRRQRKPYWEGYGGLATFTEASTERLIETEEWILQKSMWLCGTCRDVLDKRIDSANTKQRKRLVKEEKAVEKGKDIYKWLRKYLRDNTREA